MHSPALIQRRRNSALILMATGMSAGFIYTAFSDGFSRAMPVVNGLVIGALLGVFVSVIENRVFDEQLRRRLSFPLLLAIRTVVYSFLVLLVLLLVFSVSRSLWYELTYGEVWNSEEFRNYLLHGDFIIVFVYSIAIISLVIFSYQITRKLGQGYLENIITGRYYQPHVEQRVFCFLRINDIGAIMKSLGHQKYYAFINDVIYDITETILSHNGIIYQYVEGEMVIHWAPVRAVKNAACIRCFFDITDKLYSRREYYLERYGHYPKLLGALHIGQVVHGEIGHIKTEISFYGDVLNTTSRILGKTSGEDPLLLTGDLLSDIELPAIYMAEEQGTVALSGRLSPVNLFSIKERALRHQP